MIEYFGFGDFIFRLPDGAEVGRARDMKELAERLAEVPAASIAYHAERNHFSKWLKARTEFALARRLRPGAGDRLRDARGPPAEPHRGHRRVPAGPEPHARRRLRPPDVRRPRELLAHRRRLPGRKGARTGVRAGAPLRAPARATAFRDVEVSVPASVVLGTTVFDSFLDENALRDFAINGPDDDELLDRFRAAPFPPGGPARPRLLSVPRPRPDRRPLLEPPRGLAVPALHGRLRHGDASEPGAAAEAAREARRRDQARLRLDVQPARQEPPEGDALPPRRGEDGRDPPEDRRLAPRRALLPRLRGRRAVVQLLPFASHDRRRTASPPSRSAWARRSSRGSVASASARALRARFSTSPP